MASFDEVVDALRAGEPVIVPTDTVYGIAVDPTRTGATARLFEVKERPATVAVPILATDVTQAFALASSLPDVAARLAERFWPGAMTLVVARRPGLDLDLGGDDDRTIGVRVPDHDLLRRLTAEVGPLATTSANRHGRPTPETAAAAADELRGAVTLVLDGGRCAGAPSTVVECRDTGVTVLREGRIPSAAIHDALR
jgi:tRNA threonylcarbamoyl adenosine modification protein (Sua5/YciO/YrdC/YwlC family)